jgi:hypothetical protein
LSVRDAVKLAEMLTRLLEAEEHRVRLTYGRQALLELQDARDTKDAVLLIWSPNARSQTYMLEWARNIEPHRLIEIARETSDFPVIKRLAAVIDFSNWKGQRGARGWKALNERLAAIARSFEPPQLPVKQMVAAGVATFAVAGGSLLAGMNSPTETQIVPVPLEEAAVVDSDAGIGGSLDIVEPASDPTGEISVRRYREIELIDPLPQQSLAGLPAYEEYVLRDRTILETLNAYNPLRRSGDES